MTRTPTRTPIRTLTLARPDDWHLHLRDGAMLATVTPDSAAAPSVVLALVRSPSGNRTRGSASRATPNR